VDFVGPRLHLVTDTRPGRDTLGVVSAALAAARTLAATDDLAVQVRAPDTATDRQVYELAVAVLEVCRPAGVLCLVNDRLHVAVAAGADGGHVGADDLPVAAARRVLGPSAVLGATCRHPGEAVAAVAAGASYLGVGPCYATTTKAGLPDPIGPQGIARVAAAVLGTQVVAIGGLNAARADVVLRSGAGAVAVVGAVSGAADPQLAAARLLQAVAAVGAETSVGCPA
jgi:thiamine-phosphate pyrophosphorylase